jgi:diacylglycerol kinase (ATP)
MKSVLLVNPASGRGLGSRSRPALEEAAARAGLEVLVTRSGDEVVEVARDAASNADRLVIAGGDGTVHLAVQALAGSACTLGIVPVGSGNDLARALALPREPLAALDLALHAAPRPMDLGRIGETYFTGVGSVGLDARACELANRSTSRGRSMYLIAALRVLATFKPIHVHLVHDTGEFDDEVVLVAAANSPYYGGGFNVAPRAVLDDGLLELVVAHATSRPGVLAAMWSFARGAHEGHRLIRSYRTRRVKIHTVEPEPVYADGEWVAGVGPEDVEIEIAPAALRLAAPKYG